MLEINTHLQNRYHIVSKLGQGGMGAVYQATDLKFGSTVALKETLVAGEELRKAFEREARLLNNLRHAALPVVMDYFTEGDGQFLVMQYIPGDDLATLLMRAKGQPFAVSLVLQWADQLLQALEYLHEHQPPVIHRDIKPQNLKLTPRGELILLDFGLSKVSTAGMAHTNTSVSVVGYTPHYAPFEQINGVGTDPRSDLYSVATTLYHLLTGSPPPPSMTRAQNTMNGQADPLRPANELNTEVPPAVASVLHAAMAMNREMRPESAAAMRAALREASTSTVILPSTSGVDASTIVDGQTSTPAFSIPPSSGQTPLKSTREEAPRKTKGQRNWFFPVLGGLLAAVAALSFFLWSGQKTQSTPAGPVQPEASAVKEKEAKPAARSIPLPRSSFRFETVTLNENGTVKERRIGQGQYVAEDLGNGVRLEMVVIPGGKFLMGSPETSKERYPDEGPQHEVTVSSFYMGKFEVTQAQWRAVASLPKVSRDLNPDPSQFKGDNRPVENVSFDDAMEFCRRLSKKTGRTYRLPSEAEWEYACRAGTTTPFAFGETITPEFVNYDGSPASGSATTKGMRGETIPVGSLGVANAFGLYDIHGNVWEWCLGEYHDSYRGAPTDGSPWLTSGDEQHHVVRGGSWHNLDIDTRSANRSSYAHDGRYNDIGFRLLMELEQNAQ